MAVLLPHALFRFSSLLLRIENPYTQWVWIANPDQRRGVENPLGRNPDQQKPNIRRVGRIVYYAEDLGHSFVYYTNNFYLAAKDIALLYRYRWQVELFFKWIKQHLRVKRFWGDSENAVRIQIHVAIITYCLIAIIEHDLKLGRPVFEVMRILGSSLLVKDDLLELFRQRQNDMDNSGQMELNLDY